MNKQGTEGPTRKLTRREALITGAAAALALASCGAPESGPPPPTEPTPPEAGARKTPTTPSPTSAPRGESPMKGDNAPTPDDPKIASSTETMVDYSQVPEIVPHVSERRMTIEGAKAWILNSIIAELVAVDPSTEPRVIDLLDMRKYFSNGDGALSIRTWLDHFGDGYSQELQAFNHRAKPIAICQEILQEAEKLYKSPRTEMSKNIAPETPEMRGIVKEVSALAGISEDLLWALLWREGGGNHYFTGLYSENAFIGVDGPTNINMQVWHVKATFNGKSFDDKGVDQKLPNLVSLMLGNNLVVLPVHEKTARFHVKLNILLGLLHYLESARLAMGKRWTAFHNVSDADKTRIIRVLGRGEPDDITPEGLAYSIYHHGRYLPHLENKKSPSDLNDGQLVYLYGLCVDFTRTWKKNQPWKNTSFSGPGTIAHQGGQRGEVFYAQPLGPKTKRIIADPEANRLLGELQAFRVYNELRISELLLDKQKEPPPDQWRRLAVIFMVCQNPKVLDSIKELMPWARKLHDALYNLGKLSKDKFGEIARITGKVDLTMAAQLGELYSKIYKNHFVGKHPMDERVETIDRSKGQWVRKLTIGTTETTKDSRGGRKDISFQPGGNLGWAIYDTAAVLLPIGWSPLTVSGLNSGLRKAITDPSHPDHVGAKLYFGEALPDLLNSLATNYLMG